MPNIAGGYEWSEQEVEQAISAYRQFLKDVLNYRMQDQNAPSDIGPAPNPVVDIVWHTHILFTQKYHEDCANIFGEYIHHMPRVDPIPSGQHNPIES